MDEEEKKGKHNLREEEFVVERAREARPRRAWWAISELAYVSRICYDVFSKEPTSERRQD